MSHQNPGGLSLKCVLRLSIAPVGCVGSSRESAALACLTITPLFLHPLRSGHVSSCPIRPPRAHTDHPLICAVGLSSSRPAFIWQVYKKKVIVSLSLRSLIRFPFSGDPLRRPSLFLCLVISCRFPGIILSARALREPLKLATPRIRRATLVVTCGRVQPKGWLLPESDVPPLRSRVARNSPRAAPPSTLAP